MPSTSIDRQALRTIAERIQQVLNTIDIPGVKLTVGNGKYAYTHGELKLLIGTISDDGQVKSKEAVAYEKYAGSFGLPNVPLGTTFTDRLEGTMKIIGLRTKARTRPFLCEATDGKKYVYSADSIKYFLNRA